MFYSIEQKVAVLLKKGFKRFDQDWLLIYDNWSLPALDRHKATSFLLDFVNRSEVLNAFKRIYIITGQDLCKIASTGIQFYDINDLWNCKESDLYP